ncbi:hypothetical protein NE237_008430 [Protea cynaroides]|uniref:Uncharacterized protein n=1 Tax=Protea cynaroides TaxID=273540 RepID=A0A9Q0QZB5_9MAGN|nr:hypothetical protein NE237_008430 [Protea cynaroides]
MSYGKLRIDTFLHKYSLVKGFSKETRLKLLGDVGTLNLQVSRAEVTLKCAAKAVSIVRASSTVVKVGPRPLVEGVPRGQGSSSAVSTGGSYSPESASAKRRRNLEEILEDNDVVVDAEVKETFVELVQLLQKKSSKGLAGPVVSRIHLLQQKGLGASRPKVVHKAPSTAKDVSRASTGIPLVDKGKGLASDPLTARSRLPKWLWSGSWSLKISKSTFFPNKLARSGEPFRWYECPQLHRIHPHIKLAIWLPELCESE